MGGRGRAHRARREASSVERAELGQGRDPCTHATHVEAHTMTDRASVAAAAFLLVLPASGRAQTPGHTLSTLAEQLMGTLRGMQPNPDDFVSMLDVRKRHPERSAYSMPATPGRAQAPGNWTSHV